MNGSDLMARTAARGHALSAGSLMVIRTSDFSRQAATGAMVQAILACSVWAVLFAPRGFGQLPPALQAARQQLIRELMATGDLKNPRVIASIEATPRHEFIPLQHRQMAYFDMSLPIGERQTISSPFIVAFMTEALDPQPEDRVLEIGTGSGYQAAVLSPLVREVYTIEIIEPLGQRAAATLKRLNYRNVHVRIGDGFQGWPEHAPFDKIIVTCSPENVPKPLVEQLREGGRMVVPVGERYQQTLYLFEKVDGKLEGKALQPTLFVPMLGQAEELRSDDEPAKPPAVVNGDFEEPLGESGYIAGWYYQRQAELETDPEAPSGSKVVVFRNETPGRPSHLLQGMSVDGSNVSRLRISAWVRSENVRAGPYAEMRPNVILRFYDGNRKEIAHQMLGPWRETRNWTHHTRLVRVPREAREMIVHVGLLGAVGEVAFDAITVEQQP